jgi:hypothetical protein
MTLKALVNVVENNKNFAVECCGMSLSKFEEGGENYSDNFWKVEIITAIIFR